MTADERRNHARFPFASRLEIRQRGIGRTFAGEDVQRIARGTAFDVSVGGLGFRSSLPLTIGDEISVSLQDAEEFTAGLDGDSHFSPRRGEGGLFEVLAIVRHVKQEQGQYTIGAERRTPG